MQQVRNHHSKVLGQVRGQASSHIDVAIGRELGFGGHTLSVGSVQHSVLCKVRQPAAMYVSENALLVVPVADRNDAFSMLMRPHREEAKFVIPFRQIADIQVQRKASSTSDVGMGAAAVRRRAEQDQKAGLVFSEADDEARRQRIVIHLANDRETECFLDVHDSPVFARHLISAWTSYGVLRAARVGKLSGSASSKLALEYLAEVSNELRDALARGNDGAVDAVLESMGASVRACARPCVCACC